VVEIDDYTIEEDDHGNQYKKHHRRELKGKFAVFDTILSKIAPMVLYQKEFDKNGNLSCRQLLDSMKTRVED
jgi:hypothetical protein